MREMKVNPKVWWLGWWLFASYAAAVNFTALVHHVAGLPHDTLCGPFAALADLALFTGALAGARVSATKLREAWRHDPTD
jgi:hypothetical protein